MPASQDITQWIGHSETARDRIDLRPVRALAATLDIDPASFDTGDPLPPGWHWLYFAALARANELGPDGHPRRGGFLPPVRLPRRMWAGGRLEFGAPLRIGEPVERQSTVVNVQRKHGRSGELVFVLVRHELNSPSGGRLSEEHDIVYRQDHVSAAAPEPAAPSWTARWRRRLRPDPVLLFRYSALTFNGHRIHYDADYCRDVENYPDLVVHGPLLATLLLQLATERAPTATIRRFRFRAARPVFQGEPIELLGRPEGATIELAVVGADGAVSMEATAETE